MIAKASGNQLFFRAAEMLEVMYTTWMVGFQRVKQALNITRGSTKQLQRCNEEDHLEDVLRNVKLDSAAAGC